MPKLPEHPFVEEAPIVHPATGVPLGAYAHRILGDAGGLTQYGVHLERLPPCTFSSVRHWHETEDEFCYILSGEVILHENDGETLLRSGDAAAWPAGQPDGHRLENRSAGPAAYLIVGTRNRQDVIHYPDHDRIVQIDREAGTRQVADGRGNPVEWR
jgi:uncharacterized cupin superfamily protein